MPKERETPPPAQVVGIDLDGGSISDRRRRQNKLEDAGITGRGERPDPEKPLKKQDP